MLQEDPSGSLWKSKWSNLLAQESNYQKNIHEFQLEKGRAGASARKISISSVLIFPGSLSPMGILFPHDIDCR
jgi:hypothetical protein